MPPLRCLDCNDLVDPMKNGVYREVVGWAKVRGPGGTNSVMAKKETGNLLCGPCGERRKLHASWGIQEGQGTLI